MPWGLRRCQQSGDLHFITFSCYRRQPLLATPQARRVFEQTLERVRRWYGLFVTGYVVMPEHVHLLVSEPERSSLAVALQMLKQISARKLLPTLQRSSTGTTQKPPRFWQTRYYDFNVDTRKKRIEKLRYMHRNPVRRGLVTRPEDWEWSSFRHHATGEEGGGGNRIPVDGAATGAHGNAAEREDPARAHPVAQNRRQGRGTPARFRTHPFRSHRIGGCPTLVACGSLPCAKVAEAAEPNGATGWVCSLVTVTTTIFRRARYDSSGMGRFLSPDWSEIPDPVPSCELVGLKLLRPLSCKPGWMRTSRELPYFASIGSEAPPRTAHEPAPGAFQVVPSANQTWSRLTCATPNKYA